MTMFRSILSFLLLSSLLSAQDYKWPIRASRSLSATFCEYRSGHLHAGIDIKTWGEIEVPCLAVESGYIEKILIGYNGYGRGLFLRLKDGNLVVYGHLERFSDEIEEIIKSEQIEKDRYSLRLQFDPDRFPVKAGQIIGFSGTSGTEHPHLHFEIHDSLNQALNPQLFYSGINDSRDPVLDEVIILPDRAHGHVNNSRLPKIIDLEDSGGPVSIGGPFQIAINAHDRANGTLNKYNIYSAQILVNDSLVYERTFDRVPLSLTDYVDHIYPGYRGKHGWRFMSMFNSEANESPFASESLTGQLTPGGVSTLEIKVADIIGNQTSKGILFRGQESDSWKVDQQDDYYEVTRTYKTDDYQRVQFFSGANTFIPVFQTLYRLNSTTWIINKARSRDGIRALRTGGGENKWIIPPPTQPEPEFEKSWFNISGSYMLRIESMEPYIFPLDFKLTGPGFVHEGELIQTSPYSAETELISRTYRARANTMQMVIDSINSISIDLHPYEEVPPVSDRIFSLDQFGVSLEVRNSGDRHIFITLDTLSAVYNNRTIVGARVKTLGTTKKSFKGELLFKHPGFEKNQNIFSPGKKDSWKRVTAVDTTGGTLLSLHSGGSFFLLIDDQPPSVVASGKKSSYKPGDRLVFKIRDNSGIIPRPRHSMTATLDNHKFFPDYNPLRNELSFRIHKNLRAGNHEFGLIIEDESGNQNNFIHQFIVRR